MEPRGEQPMCSHRCFSDELAGWHRDTIGGFQRKMRETSFNVGQPVANEPGATGRLGCKSAHASLRTRFQISEVKLWKEDPLLGEGAASARSLTTQERDPPQPVVEIIKGHS